jgi:integrase
MLLKQGVGMKDIQAWLGHSTYNTTANLYAHLDSESKVGVGTVMENLLDLSSALETV